MTSFIFRAIPSKLGQLADLSAASLWTPNDRRCRFAHGHRVWRRLACGERDRI
jgi:hypothetical protein